VPASVLSIESAISLGIRVARFKPKNEVAKFKIESIFMNKLANVLLSNLRSKDLSQGQFRFNAHLLSQSLAQQAANHVHTQEITINTPLGAATGQAFTNHLVLVPILRSGLVLLPAFISYFPDAGIGCVGLRRDEKTAVAHFYYQNLPKLFGSEQLIMLDPMIATGGSAIATLNIVSNLGIKQEQIIFVAMIASQDGIDAVKNVYPKIRLLVAAIDKNLNKDKFIVPGLGDFGDRYFGTEKQ